MGIFGFGRGGKQAKGEGVSKPSHESKKPSAIQKMKEMIDKGYGVAPDSSPFAVQGQDEMTDAEYTQAIDSLFPIRLSDFAKAIEDGVDPFPVKTDMVDMSVPTMDDITGGAAGAKGIASRAITAKGSPRSSGSETASRRYYPPRNGFHSGLEGGGLSMLPDPLLRFPINPRVLKHFQSRIWITYTGCAIIATHEFVNRACSIPAEDAIAHGYKVVCSSPKHKHDNQHDADEAMFLNDIKKAADRMGLNEACVKLNYKKKVFGVGIAIPWVEFKSDYKSPTDKSGRTPYSYADAYDPRAVKPGSFKGFAVIDPHWLTYQWDKDSRTDPTSPFFLTPTWVKVRDKRIHRSWIIRAVNSELPDIFKPVYLYGGLSLTQMIYERVWAADKLANEAPLLAMTKRLLVIDGNLEQMQSDSARTNKMFNTVNYFRDNFSLFVKRPTSNVTQLDTSLSELTPLTMSQYQLVAAIAQIPVTKLLKNVPTGLQATGQYEWDDYAQSLKTIQTNDYTPLCKMFFELYVASNYPNRKDLRLDIEWNPIDVPKESEVAQMTSQAAQTVAHLLNTGIIDVAEARAMLRKTNLPMFQTVPTEVPDLLKKIEDAKDPSNAMGGGGGLGAPMGGDAPPQEPEQQAPAELPPEVKKNDEVFKSVMKQFLEKHPDVAGEGEDQQDDTKEEGSAEQRQQPKQEPPNGVIG